MALEEKKFKRTHYLVDKSMQLRYIAFNAGAMLAFSLVIALGIYFGVWYAVSKEFSVVRLSEDMQTINRLQEYDSARTSRAIAHVPFVGDQIKMLSDHQQQVLGDILMRSNRRLIPIFLGLLGFVLLFTLILTHRVAGPMYRMRKNLERVMSGDLTVNFKLRPKDQGKELAGEMSHVVEEFAGTLRAVREASASLKDAQSQEERMRIASKLDSIIGKYTI